MELVATGHISDESAMRQVIDSLLQQSSTQPSLLRITSPGDNLNGRLAVTPGGYIVSARDDSGDEGYPVIRKLLGVTNGSFALLAARQDEIQEMVQNAYVQIDSVLENLDKKDLSCAVAFDHERRINEQPVPGKESSGHAAPATRARRRGEPAWSRHIPSLPPRNDRFTRLSRFREQMSCLRNILTWSLSIAALAALASFCLPRALHLF